jgi:hypothetical protein
MHLNRFETFICSMFCLLAFEAEFFLAEIEIQYSEFLS